MLVREMQYKNAFSPILVMLSGIVTLAREEQFENVLSPILDAPVGIATLVREQVLNTYIPIIFVFLLIEQLVINLVLTFTNAK